MFWHKPQNSIHEICLHQCRLYSTSYNSSAENCFGNRWAKKTALVYESRITKKSNKRSSIANSIHSLWSLSITQCSVTLSFLILCFFPKKITRLLKDKLKYISVTKFNRHIYYAAMALSSVSSRIRYNSLVAKFIDSDLCIFHTTREINEHKCIHNVLNTKEKIVMMFCQLSLFFLFFLFFLHSARKYVSCLCLLKLYIFLL